MNAKLAVAVLVVIVVAGAAAYALLGREGGEAGGAGEAAATATPAAAPVEVVRVGVVADQLVTDPAAAHNPPSLWIASLAADTLVKVDPATGKLEPGLAVKWSTPDNGVTWVFVLREGVTFPDGTPVDADAVVRSVQRLMAVRGPYSWLANAFIVSVKAVNETAVEFQLRIPIATFPQLLSAPVFAVTHPSLDLFKAEPQATLVGAGPYTIVAASPTSVVLEANPDYYAGEPFVKKIVVKAYDSSEALRAAAEKGEVDIVWWGISSGDMKTLEAKGFKASLGDPLVLKLLALNTGKGPLSDPEVRLAIARAIDQADLSGILPGDYDEPAYSIIPSVLLGYTDVFRGISSNPAGAKDILQDKGYSEENKLELTLAVSPGLYGAIDLDIAEIVKNQLEATGMITVEIVEVSPVNFHKELARGAYDMAIVTVLPVYPDPTYYVLATMYSRANKPLGTGYSNPQVDAVIENILGTVDYSVREEAFQAIQETFLASDIPYVPLVEIAQPIAYGPESPIEAAIAANLFPVLGG